MDKTTRRVYSAEELHRLRSTCSQPKLRESIEKHDDGDAELVKEHVLRGSKSFAARSFRSRASGNSLRVPSSNKENCSTQDTESLRQSSGLQAPANAFVLGEIAPNSQLLRTGAHKFRPSPTPSLKKKKAEAIVKAHGSPQHVRVTAGGRIVPSEQSPLCHPRYGYSAIKVNGGLIKFAPNHPMGKAQWTQATQNGFVAQDVNGRLCQIVDGTILPLNEVDGALRLYVPAPNLNVSTRGSSFGQSAPDRVATMEEQQFIASQNKNMGPPEPSPAAQTNALELEYHKIEHELKELDKTEVLHGRTMGKVAKDALFGKRRELVMTLDQVRKAIKSIKQAPPPDAPTSPRAMQDFRQISPPRSRLPAFLQDRVRQNNMNAAVSNASNGMMMQGGYTPFYGVSSAMQARNQFGFPPVPEMDTAFDVPTYNLAPSTLFVPPPPFDGPVAQSYSGYPVSNGAEVSSSAPEPTSTGVSSDAVGATARPPQTDGAGSTADLRKSSNSRALEIKIPDRKQSAAVKSTLNPMSPAYKPGAGVLQSSGDVDNTSAKSTREAVQLSPVHQLRPAAALSKACNMTNDTISPTKKSPHLHSSSTSSFETADFFPRDTREYSTRKYDYPEQADSSEDKENVSPPQQGENDAGDRPSKASASTNWRSRPSAPSDHARVVSITAAHRESPAPPPGTPVASEKTENLDSSSVAQRRSAIEERLSQEAEVGTVPDREAHNLSPKSKRQDWLFVQNQPEPNSQTLSSSPEKFESARQELCVISSPAELDFSAASSEWIEGYRAGLARRPVRSDRDGEFLDGYCAGLLKSKPAPVNIGPSTGSPSKPVSRRPSPAAVQSRNVSGRGPSSRTLEISLPSIDTLKQAVFAPANENAVLTPTADDPHANDSPFNLGAWAKDQSVEQKNHVDASAVELHGSATMKRQMVLSENDAAAQLQGHSFDVSKQVNRDSVVSMPAMPMASELPGVSVPRTVSSMASDPTTRVSSLPSIDANLHRQFPDHRVFSPHLDWKAGTSIAQAAGLASAMFATDQNEDTRDQARGSSDTLLNTKSRQRSRFKEGSIDGITNPPNSPQSKSPPKSPSSESPPKGRAGKAPQNKKDSPSKPGSPAKVKFEHIAEKVGIKVAGSSGHNNAGSKNDEGSSPSSPSGKRRWRDVWRSSAARKDPGNEEP